MYALRVNMLVRRQLVRRGRVRVEGALGGTVVTDFETSIQQCTERLLQSIMHGGP